MTSTWEATRAAYERMREAMQVSLPEGESGEVRLATFTVAPEHRFGEVLSMMKTGRGVPAGTYTALYRRGGLWMSDTPDERNDHLPFVHGVYERGDSRILVGGLGLGMVISALLTVDSVIHIDVIEIDPDVIALVGPTLTERATAAGKSLTIVQGDCMDPRALFPTGTTWDAAWIDIWRDLCTDNLAEMSTISRRLARRCPVREFWGRELLRYHRSQERRSYGGFAWR